MSDLQKALTRAAAHFSLRKMLLYAIERNGCFVSQTMNEIKPFSHAPVLENTMFYMGSLISFLANGNETAGRFALVDITGKIGNEPPPHVHLWEHEFYYVLKGELEFYLEGEEESFLVYPGQTLLVPQGKAHALYSRSATYRTLIMLLATDERAVGMDRYFRLMAEPATSLELPAQMVTYAMADPQRAIKVAADIGTIFLTPDEVKQRLPYYAGFGANLPGGPASRETSEAKQTL